MKLRVHIWTPIAQPTIHSPGNNLFVSLASLSAAKMLGIIAILLYTLLDRVTAAEICNALFPGCETAVRALCLSSLNLSRFTNTYSATHSNPPSAQPSTSRTTIPTSPSGTPNSKKSAPPAASLQHPPSKSLKFSMSSQATGAASRSKAAVMHETSTIPFPLEA